MKQKSNLINISISKEIHKALVDHIQAVGDGKIGKFAERAIKDRIEKEKPKPVS